MNAADVLTQHYFQVAMRRCKCMEMRGAFEPAMSSTEHAAHQLDALKAAGYEVVKLPESSVDEMGALTWPVTQHWQGKRMNDGEVRIRKSDGRISATSVSNPNDCPEDARSLGLALLAAAAAHEARS